MPWQSIIPPGRFWAKLNDQRTEWHPLSAHSADVAAVFRRLLHPSSRLADRLARAAGVAELTEGHRARLVLLAALHDLGKTSRKFQERAVLPERTSLRGRGHVKVLLESVSHPPVRDVVHPLYALLVPGAPQNGYDLFTAAIAHHGRPWYVDANRDSYGCWKAGGGLDPTAGMRRLVELARGWSGVDEWPDEGLPHTPALTHLFAGALTLADWIGSTESAFKHVGVAADDDPDGYWQEACGRAERACAIIGVVPRTRPIPASVRGDALLERVFPALFGGDAPRPPTPLQRHVAGMPLPEPGSRILIESETGSGKTEAALALYARLRSEERVGGLFFALPTRATATAMHERVRAAVAGIYPEGERPTLALAIGGGTPWTAADPALEEPRTTYEDDDDRELQRWATASAKTFFAAEIVVGTLDQALLAGLPVRHAHLRLAGLARHLLVVDELHSFDRYAAEVLQSLLRLLERCGGYALFMSATLSDAARRRLADDGAEEGPSREAAVARPYPVVSVLEPGTGAWADHGLARAGGQPEKEIGWRACAEDEALAAAVEAAEAGARVCVLRNTVDLARRTAARLREGGADALLWRPGANAFAPPYHSRYTRPDRAALDEAVLRAFGRGGTAEGKILIATQVVEQSLDVDFDFFVTDLCPVDQLLQRLGRLHRHPERDRPPAYRGASARVIAPAEGLVRWLASGRGPNGWGTVYEDLGDLHLTLELLRSRPRVRIPRDNRELIEAVYHPEVRRGLEASAEWIDYLEKRDGKTIAQETYAHDTALPFGRTYSDERVVRKFELENKIRTRLGDDTVRVSLPTPVLGWYSEGQADHVDLPADVIARSGADAEDGELRAEHIATDTHGARFLLGEQELAYLPDGWSWTREG